MTASAAASVSIDMYSTPDHDAAPCLCSHASFQNNSSWCWTAEHALRNAGSIPSCVEMRPERNRRALRLDHILLEHRCTPQTRPFVASLLLIMGLLDVHLSSRAIYACCYWVHFNVSSSTDNNPAHSLELTDLSALSCDRLVPQSSTRRIKDWITATSVFFPSVMPEIRYVTPVHRHLLAKPKSASHYPDTPPKDACATKPLEALWYTLCLLGF